MGADEEKISELWNIPDETTQDAEQKNKEMGNIKKEIKRHDGENERLQYTAKRSSRGGSKEHDGEAILKKNY